MVTMAVFILTRDVKYVWTSLGKFNLVRLVMRLSIKKGTRWIARHDAELST